MRALPPEIILARTFAALGGRDRLELARARSARGTIEAFGGLVGPYRSYAMAPGKLRVEWTLAGIECIKGVDGHIAWESDGAGVLPHVLGSAAADRAKRRARFDWILGHAQSACPMALVSSGGRESQGVHVIRFDSPDGLPELLAVDETTYLPQWAEDHEIHDEGAIVVRTRYADWRTVDGLALPYTVARQSPDLDYTVRIEAYRHEDELPDALFAHPLTARWGQPNELALATLPTRVYKEGEGLVPGRVVRFWGIPNAPMERWTVNVLVRERLGRYAQPIAATITLFSGREVVKTECLEHAALRAVTRAPASRFCPQDEVFHLRHRFVEPVSLAIDRMHYVLSAQIEHSRLQASLDIPLGIYVPRTPLRCPLRGPFVVSVGHEPAELSHTYEWSQQYAWDMIPLGPNFSPIQEVSDGSQLVDVVAPADGLVVRARDDVPDDMPPTEYLKLQDPLYAIGGNGMVLDHGTGEYSALFHLRHGSVRVRSGDRVRQGQVLGSVGSAGTPGYPHLHYHLQAGPDFLAADGLPARFDNVVLDMGLLAPYQRGQHVPVPVRGVIYTTT
jgi:hypothetical protein